MWSSSESVSRVRDKTILCSQRLLSPLWVHGVFCGDWTVGLPGGSGQERIT